MNESALQNLATEMVRPPGWAYAPRGREKGKLDCFGLVWYVANEMGYPLPDYEYETGDAGEAVFLENYYRHVDPVESYKMRPGDVLFLKMVLPQGNHFHVGIYLGCSRMLHCSRKSGVVIQRIDIQPVNRAEIKAYRFRAPC